MLYITLHLLIHLQTSRQRINMVQDTLPITFMLDQVASTADSFCCTLEKLKPWVTQQIRDVLREADHFHLNVSGSITFATAKIIYSEELDDNDLLDVVQSVQIPTCAINEFTYIDEWYADQIINNPNLKNVNCEYLLQVYLEINANFKTVGQGQTIKIIRII